MRSLLFVSLLFVSLLLAACTDPAPVAPRQHLPVPDAPTFTLFVSNQSFDLSQVDIEVRLDDQLAVSGDFLVEGQHTWVQFDFALAPGPHRLRATSETAGVTLEQAFDMDERRWGVVSFWYYAAGSPEPTPKHLAFEVLDEAPLFQ
jgi:hypothetical protein